MDSFKKELALLLNRYIMEHGSNTPDYVLAEYLANCLVAFDKGVCKRQQHYTPEAADYAEINGRD